MKLEAILESEGDESISLALCDRLARLHENAGDFARAGEVLELIQRRDPSQTNLATRIEELRLAMFPYLKDPE